MAAHGSGSTPARPHRLLSPSPPPPADPIIKDLESQPLQEVPFSQEALLDWISSFHQVDGGEGGEVQGLGIEAEGPV